MSFEIKQATRDGVKPLIGVYGGSGDGKTRSALLLARGLAGEKGEVVLIDTENGRGRIFADVIPGGYKVIDFAPPYSPDRYAEALAEAEKIATVIVKDSMSHGWDGEGGVLDMHEDELDRIAGEDYRKREACKLLAWTRPKMSQKKLVGAILRSKCPIICCLRAQEKTRIVKGEDGKSKVVTDDFKTPIYDPRFIYEMLINLEVRQVGGKGGFCNITKITHEDLFKCLPDADHQLSIEHGKLIADWCAKRGAQSAVKDPKKEKAELAAQLIKVLAEHKVVALSVSGAAERKARTAAIEKWLLEKSITSDTESLAEMPIDRLREVVAKAEMALIDVVP